MAEDQDDSQKTEEPTQKRLDDARKKGDFPKSQDVPVWFALVGVAGLMTLAQPLAANMSRPLVMLLDHPHQFQLTDGGAQRLMGALLGAIGPGMGVIFGVIIVFSLAGHLVQHPPVWTADKMKPKLDKLSPLKGFGRLFGPQGWMNLFKGLLKMTAAGIAVTAVLWPSRHELLRAGEMDLVALPGLLQDKASQLIWATLLIIGLVSIMDYVYQRHSFMKRMRMSREDIKQENKQSEGDPMIRARLRQIRMERSRRRMLQSVPEATVIITNPTHYSVALKYDPDENPAPIVVAMGVDALALRIREAANEHNVPIIENPPLARALYATAELDDVIPREHFEAVAKVISFVMRQAERKR